jgi:hypothetical protein
VKIPPASTAATNEEKKDLLNTEFSYVRSAVGTYESGR